VIGMARLASAPYKALYENFIWSKILLSARPHLPRKTDRDRVSRRICYGYQE
jgi:hypothetical protein